MSGGPGSYAIGVLCLLVICGSLLLAAVGLRRRFFPGWSGSLARLVEALTGVALLVGILQALGTFGLYRLAPIVIVSMVLGVAVLAGTGGSGGRRHADEAPALLAASLAVLAGATVAAEWASPTLQAYDLGIHTFDSLWYHLPWAAGFAQSGHVTQLHYDLEFLLAFYPATGELLHGLGILALGHDTLSPALNLLWMGLTVLAAWCIGQSRRVGPASAWAIAVILVTPMMYFSQAGSADDDILGVFFLLAAAALLLNAEDRTAPYVLAALSAGLAASVKLTFLAPAAALTVGVLAIAPAGGRRRRAAVWLGPLFVGGGFWYVRNLIAVGNPFPWTSFGVLPTPAPPLEQPTTYSVAHYLTSARFWDVYFVAGIASQLGRWWYLLLGIAILGPLLCLLPGAGGALRMLALVALAGLLAYLLTPNGAMGPSGDPVGFAFNLRFALPGLALAFALAPLAPAFSEHAAARGSLLAVLVAALAATTAQADLWPHQHDRGAVALGVLVLALGLAVVWGRHLLGRARSRAPLIALGVGAGTLLCAAAAAGYPWQQRYLRHWYAAVPKTSDLAPVWGYFRDVRDARIALVGTYGEFLLYPLLGRDDSNRVEYIAHVGSHGSFTPITSCREFRLAVDAGHFDYLITTPTRNFWVPHRLFYAPEGSWTVSDPAARVLISYLAAGRRVSVFGLTGPLDPSACP